MAVHRELNRPVKHERLRVECSVSETRHRRPLKLTERWREMRRARLLAALIMEIEKDGDGITVLYASLLARNLIATSKALATAFGEQIEQLAGEDEENN